MGLNNMRLSDQTLVYEWKIESYNFKEVKFVFTIPIHNIKHSKDRWDNGCKILLCRIISFRVAQRRDYEIMGYCVAACNKSNARSA